MKSTFLILDDKSFDKAGVGSRILIFASDKQITENSVAIMSKIKIPSNPKLVC